jgi:TetR/AcrR family transcriptional regulator, transcriptional repressor of aconitase
MVSEDVASKRDDVLAAAAHVIGEQGLEAASMREIARAAGCTTGVLTHYFRNKDEMITAALDLAFDQLETRPEQRPGIDALQSLKLAFLETLPTDLETRRWWKVWLHAVARSLADPAIADSHAHRYARVRSAIRDALERAARERTLSPGLDLDNATDHLLGWYDGVATHATLEPERYPRERQRELIDAGFRCLSGR